MKHTYLLVLLFVCIVWCDKRVRKKPTVLIEILVRNKAHTLPYFLTFLERLDYPKNRICLWIRSDNNVDNSINIVEEWLNSTGHNYHMLDVKLDNVSKGFENEKGLADWSADRFAHVINLREEALRRAREIWADFIWVLDADVFLTNPKTLDYLISKDAPVVAPLLKSDGLYSNFWAGMSSDYYYLRTERYDPILHGEEKGCFEVPMVHSAVLIDLGIFDTDHLTYRAKNLPDYDGPDDDIISFAMSANKSGIPLTVCNEESFGFVMVPIQDEQTISDDVQRLTNLKMEILNQENHLPVSETLRKYVKYAEPDTLNLENIFMINLLRRPERRVRMQKFFKELGIKAEIIDAVDGRKLDENALIEWGIKMMPEYADPYHKRPMTMGEVGCFLSHYVIWNEILDRDYQKVMVLEDDVRFEIFFRQKIEFLLWELERLGISWDLVYLGRKKLLEGDEPYVEDSEHLVYAKYSYWTLGYLISASGAKKLVEADPLKKLLPVDEYIPLLSDVHPRDDWKQHYPERDLVTLSVNPLLIHPTHYTGEKGYISDTENSKIISEGFISNDPLQMREEL